MAVAHQLGYGLKVLLQRLLDGKKLKVILQYHQVTQEQGFMRAILKLILILERLM